MNINKSQSGIVLGKFLNKIEYTKTDCVVFRLKSQQK